MQKPQLEKSVQEKVLVLCPSRGRPRELGRMIDSFLSTSKMATLKVMLDMDDPQLMEYEKTIAGRVPFSIGFRKPTTQLINENWRFSAECFRWFSVTNDDFVYRTDAWDLKLLGTLKLHGGMGIVYGNDLLCGANLPTTSIITREIVEALGWLQLPSLTCLFGDTVWSSIGKGAGCLFYRQDVIIEHLHPFNRKVEKDATFHRTNSEQMWKVDEAAFVEWLTTKSKEDIKKVKELCMRKVQT